MPEGVVKVGAARARAVQLALNAIRDLADWPEADALAERAVEALRGGEGLSRADLDRLTRWPRRWTGLHPDLRAFYVAAVDASFDGKLNEQGRAAVHLGLLSVLDDREAEGWVRGCLKRAHVDLLGEELALDPCPRVLPVRTGSRP